MKIDKKQQVITKARDVFLRHGFARTTMNDLAQAAGMSRPALYLIFQNKDEVFAATFTHSMNRRLDGLISSCRPEWSLSKKLFRVMEVMIAEYYENIRSYHNSDDLLSLGSPLPGVREHFLRVVEYVASLLKEPLEGSQFKSSPHEIAQILMSAAQGFEAIAADGPELRRMLATHVELIATAILGSECRIEEGGSA